MQTIRIKAAVPETNQESYSLCKLTILTYQVNTSLILFGEMAIILNVHMLINKHCWMT